MSNTELTRHAMTRMRQRAFHGDDLDLIRLIGTEVEGGYIVLNRDRQAAERDLKRLLQRIRRLSGKPLVIAGGCLVTVSRPGKATERRLLRDAADGELLAWAICPTV
jgi:hypothetical protein